MSEDDLRVREQRAIEWLLSVEVRAVLRERFGVDVEATFAAYRSQREKMLHAADAALAQLETIATGKTADAAAGPAELGERGSLVRMIQWVDSQIEGIQRSSMPEASRGALNAFLQVREKLSATNRQTR